MEEKKSMLSVAYDIIASSDKSVSFKKLWADVCKELNIPEDQANAKISTFYTQLTTCGIIVQEKGNSWNLASRVSYNQSHIAYDDDDAEDEPQELDEGEKEFFQTEEPSGTRAEENIDGQTDEEENNSVVSPLADFIK